MSLVGSLQDLGLGDILQIVSLSRKSGLLLLRSDSGEGRIVFRDGQVRAAFVKGEPEDLRALLVVTGFVGDADFEAAAETTRRRGIPIEEAIIEHTPITAERLDSLRREHVEHAVIQMFTWRAGEFSFEVRAEIDERDTELLLTTGINAQYLTMEATRLGDENGDLGADSEAIDDEPVFSGEDDGSEELVLGDAAGSTGPAISELPIEEFEDATVESGTEVDAVEVVAMAAVECSADSAADSEPGFVADALSQITPEIDADASTAGRPTLELAPSAAVLDSSDESSSRFEVQLPQVRSGTAVEGARGATGTRPPSLIVMDPNLPALEWLKSGLDGLCDRIHIFQRTESGIARIRQYLARGEIPIILISTDVGADTLTDSGDLAAIVRRLKAQAPRMTIVVLRQEYQGHAVGGDGADAVVSRPNNDALADSNRWPEHQRAATEVRESIEPWTLGSVTVGSIPQSVDPSSERLQRLREVSDCLEDPLEESDVLSHVLEVAAQRFPRVAMFMVREDLVVGIAQQGLAATGGPEDSAYRGMTLSVADSTWFSRVIEERRAIRAAASCDTDRQLAEQLGGNAEAEAYLAPILGSDGVIAVLYADTHPRRVPPGDTTDLEIVLHQAGMALDRALLRRAPGGVAGDREGAE